MNHRSDSFFCKTNFSLFACCWLDSVLPFFLGRSQQCNGWCHHVAYHPALSMFKKIRDSCTVPWLLQILQIIIFPVDINKTPTFKYKGLEVVMCAKVRVVLITFLCRSSCDWCLWSLGLNCKPAWWMLLNIYGSWKVKTFCRPWKKYKKSPNVILYQSTRCVYGVQGLGVLMWYFGEIFWTFLSILKS